MLTIIGHRGSHRPDGGPVENTLEAFEAALAEGADAVELDVWRTRDGREVVYHDDVLPDGRRVDGLVAAEVCATRLPRGARVPSLDEALDLLARRTIIHVELKHRAALEGAVRAVRRFRAESDVVLSSFSRRAMFDAAVTAPRIPRAVAMGTPVLDPCVRLREALPFATLRRAEATAWHAEWRLVHAPLVACLHSMGVRVNAWTVNEPGVARRLAAIGVDGVFTDRPGEMRAALR